MTQDTRKDRRVKIVSLNVRYKSATVDEFIENHAHDVSRGGIFIKTANPFPPGTLLKFEIRLASDQAVIAGVGRIVWKRDAGTTGSERPAGMGVKFIKIDEPSKAVIDRLVNTKGDAGKSFETSDDVTEAPVRTRTTPPARPAAPAAEPSTGSVSQRASIARSVTLAAGAPAAPKGSTPPPPKSVPAASPSTRKATMMGLGVAEPEGSASASPSGSSASTPPPPGRTSFSTHPSAPPRPGGRAMFPMADDEGGGMPPKEEQTVMRQAAELLEDALREAGGSMAEIGTNPLFSGTGPGAAVSAIPESRPLSPITPASEWTTADTPKALAATVAALRAEEAASHASTDKRRSEAPRTARETPTSIRPASAVAAAKKKNSAGTLVVVAIAAAFALAGAVLFRDQLFGGGGTVPEPVAAPAAPPAVPVATPPAATTMASVTTVTLPPAQTAPTASAASETPSAAPPAQPPASASAALPAQPSASTTASAAASATAPQAGVAPPPRAMKPPAKRAPPPTASDTAVAAGEAVAPAAPLPAKPVPLPKAKPEKPSDDNPY